MTCSKCWCVVSEGLFSWVWQRLPGIAGGASDDFDVWVLWGLGFRIRFGRVFRLYFDLRTAWSVRHRRSPRRCVRWVERWTRWWYSWARWSWGIQCDLCRVCWIRGSRYRESLLLMRVVSCLSESPSRSVCILSRIARVGESWANQVSRSLFGLEENASRRCFSPMLLSRLRSASVSSLRDSLRQL